MQGEGAPLHPPPRQAARARVVGLVVAEVLHRRQSDGRDGREAAVRKHVVAHDPGLPVGVRVAVVQVVHVMHQERVGGRQAAHQCEARPRSGWPISGRPPHASALVQSKYACASSYARPLVKNHTSSSSPSRSVTFLSSGHGARQCDWQPRRRPAAVCDWGVGAGRRTDELLALARRVARRTEHDVREAERVEQLVDDEGAVLGDQLLRRARPL